MATTKKDKEKIAAKIHKAETELEGAESLLGLKTKEKVRGFFDFIRSQGVIGLATGIILGTAVTAVVRSLVDDIINPLFGLMLPEDNLSSAAFYVGDSKIVWGNFVSTLLDFIIIAAVVYFVFKLLGLDKLDKKKVN